jgi:DNA helicase-2/ATP-dependent DNA helicase PcrA
MLDTLNPKQKEAVLATEGPVMIVAGAGSGKTRVLTTRIKYLIEQCSVHPESILAVTFTNKAAREMEQRIGSRLPWIGTFHGICGKLLRKHLQLLEGYTNSFVIFDDNDQASLIKQIMKEMSLDPSNKQITPAKVLGQISWAKNKMIEPVHYLNQARHQQQELIGHIYKHYQTLLQRNNAVDFDDMLLLTVKLFQKNPELLHHYQEKFKYVLVDEYQDTNKPQYTLIHMLAAKYKNICVVGDSDQNIYSWRGADITNILSFESDYPNASIVMLEQNYRSTKNIIAAANGLIKNNTQRKDKNLWTDNQDGDKIQFRLVATERDEVKYVADTIDILRADIQELNKYAIFYRTNAQSRVFEEEFIARGIPYRLVGGTKFYARKEVKDILCYLRLILNPRDELALLRVINTPARGIGEMSLGRYQLYAEDNKTTLFDVLGQKIEGIPDKALRAAFEFKMLIGEMQLMHLPLPELIDQVIHKSGYHALLINSTDEQDLDRLDNIFELVTMAKENPEMDLGGFLEHISLMSDVDKLKTEGDAVTFMTIHSAKGLEYPVVFITGLEESVLPHFRSLYDAAQMEEERRLCYVAITRAEQKLFMSAARKRSQAGETRMNDVSRFLNEIPAELLDIQEQAGSLFGDDFGGGFNITPVQSRQATAPKTVTQTFKPGDAVFHNKWGKGTVLKVFGSGEDLTVDIQFTRVRKTLLAAYAPLEKV